MMTRIKIVSFFFMILPYLSVAQIPNAGFENWTGGNPDEWFANNVEGFATPITQTNQVHGGSSALQGEVVSTIAGSMSPNAVSGVDGMGFPISQRYTSLHGFYKFSPMGGDRFSVLVEFKRGADSVAIGAIADSITHSSYTEFVVNMTYFSSATPDTAIIVFTIIGPVSGPDFHLGSVMFVDDLSFSGVVAVNENNIEQPLTFNLSQNYPNPFNPTTDFRFQIAEYGLVKLGIYDLLGREISALVYEELHPGTYQVTWDASDRASGVYYYQLNSGKFTETKKLLLLR